MTRVTNRTTRPSASPTERQPDRPVWKQQPLFDAAAEPACDASAWRLVEVQDLTGPGTMPRQAYLLWRVLQKEGPQTEQALEAIVRRDLGWHRSGLQAAVRELQRTPYVREVDGYLEALTGIVT